MAADGRGLRKLVSACDIICPKFSQFIPYHKVYDYERRNVKKRVGSYVTHTYTKFICEITEMRQRNCLDVKFYCNPYQRNPDREPQKRKPYLVVILTRYFVAFCNVLKKNITFSGELEQFFAAPKCRHHCNDSS